MKININTECRNCKELQSFIEDICKIRKEYSQNHTRDSLDCTLNVTVTNELSLKEEIAMYEAN